MQYLAVFVLYAVLHTDTVIFLLQCHNGMAKFFLILFHDRLGYHVKTI